jgi:hypothetical protein
MSALDAVYHAGCLTKFYNGQVALTIQTSKCSKEKTKEGCVFGELFAYTEGSSRDN